MGTKFGKLLITEITSFRTFAVKSISTFSCTLYLSYTYPLCMVLNYIVCIFLVNFYYITGGQLSSHTFRISFTSITLGSFCTLTQVDCKIYSFGMPHDVLTTSSSTSYAFWELLRAVFCSSRYYIMKSTFLNHDIDFIVFVH